MEQQCYHSPQLGPQMCEQDVISPIVSLPRSVLLRPRAPLQTNVSDTNTRERDHDPEELTPREVRRKLFILGVGLSSIYYHSEVP